MKQALALLLSFLFFLTALPSAPAAAQEDDTKTGKMISQWRRDAASGEGGSVSFSYDGESYNFGWGYADFRYFENSDQGKLTLLNTVQGSKEFPDLRIVVAMPVKTAKELAGKTVKMEKLTLKFERKKGTGVKGTGSVTISSIAGGFIEGRFTASMQGGGTMEGTFRARLHEAGGE